MDLTKHEKKLVDELENDAICAYCHINKDLLFHMPKAILLEDFTTFLMQGIICLGCFTKEIEQNIVINELNRSYEMEEDSDGDNKR